MFSVIGVGELSFQSDFPLTEIGAGMYTGVPQESGSVVLTAQTECGADTSEVSIDVASLPLIDAGDDVAIQPGGQATLNAQGGLTYEWSPAINLSCTACPDPIATPDSTTTYYVVGTDGNGCRGQDSVTVHVIIDIELDPVNVFTPNGDGINDFFYIGGLELFPDSKLVVFNRWGDVVFEQLAYQNDWDGTYHNNPVPAGTYLYHLQVNAFGQRVTLKGTITIIRA
jgi:gliding motility-associated-like protein